MTCNKLPDLPRIIQTTSVLSSINVIIFIITSTHKKHICRTLMILWTSLFDKYLLDRYTYNFIDGFFERIQTRADGAAIL